MPLRRPLCVLALCALVPVLSACGSRQQESISKGETEGIYVDVGPMKYQVQISRQLNPSISEDRTLLSGLPARYAHLAADEAWFAVFVRIENETKRAQTPATAYSIEDTEGEQYRPVPLGRVNPFHYVTSPVPAQSVAPDIRSVAAQTSIGGMELLFKIKRPSFDDRPLVLKIHSPEDYSAVSEVDLDV